MMNQEFDEKRGITNEDIKKHEEKQEEIYLQNKQTKKFRVTCGRNFKDFNDMNEAIKYLKKRLLKYAYASINTITNPDFFEIQNADR